MKLVSVNIVLELEDDIPVVDWLYDLIETQLEPQESIIHYEDNEPTLKALTNERNNPFLDS